MWHSTQPRRRLGSFIDELSEADIYFIVNTGNCPHVFTATFRTEKPGAEWWDPFSGTTSRAGSGAVLKMALAPYESRVVVFTDHAQSGKCRRRLHISIPSTCAATGK